MINNLDKISSLLKFDSEDDFYFLEIIKRRKENPEIASNARVIKSYYVYSLEYLEKIMPEIIQLCDLENARAYINLNKRSFEKIAYQTLKKVTDCIISRDFRSVKKSYNSACGSFANEKDKKWVIDIDWIDFVGNKGTVGGVLVPMLEAFQQDAGNEPLIEYIPTKNGVHIITRPFNKQLLHGHFPNVDIQTNSPTLLYIS